MTVGVRRCVLMRTISTSSVAVGTGFIDLKLYTGIVQSFALSKFTFAMQQKLGLTSYCEVVRNNSNSKNAASDGWWLFPAFSRRPAVQLARWSHRGHWSQTGQITAARLSRLLRLELLLSVSITRD